jgi:CRISPR-associated protein Cas2
MRSVYVVAYDISDPKRLRKVYELMLGWGDRVQLSVFRCELTLRELAELRASLSDIIQHLQDQVMFVDIGPADGRGATAFTTIGRPLGVPPGGPIVV